MIKRLITNISLLLAAIIFCVIILEISLRVSYPLYSNFNTEMWLYSTEIKKLSLFPGVSHEHMPNKRAVLYGVELKTNSLGFRDYNYSIAKPENTTRIMLLGDSITLGWGVNFSDIYSEYLERMLNKNSSIRHEVLNSAVGNYNTEMEVQILKKYITLKPDIVILAFFPNDGEKTMIIKPDTLYQLKKRLYLYPFFWDRYMKMKYLFAKGNYSKIHSFYTEDYGGKYRINESFAELKQLQNKYRFKVYVAVIPQFYDEFESYKSGYIHDFVNGLCVEYGFRCIDVLESFKNYRLADVIVSKEDAHPNALGHRIIAEAIYNSMKNELKKSEDFKASFFHRKNELKKSEDFKASFFHRKNELKK